MDTFETIDKQQLKDTAGVLYVDYRNSLKQAYATAWLSIFLYYVAIAIAICGLLWLQKNNAIWLWAGVPIGSIVVGYCVAAFNLFMHEASHYHLAMNRKRNDILSNLFLGLIIGMDVHFYRSVHFVHHRLIGTKNDTEKSYFEALSTTFLLESIFGIRLIRVMLNRNHQIRENYGAEEGVDIVGKNNFIFVSAALLHFLWLVSLFYSGYWAVALAWAIGMLVVFPFLAMFRQILEHRTPDASTKVDYTQVDQGASHRMFGDSFFASTFGAAGFNRHLLHHWDPQIPYTRLGDVEYYLQNTVLHEALEKSRTTYLQTFLMLFSKSSSV